MSSEQEVQSSGTIYRSSSSTYSSTVTHSQSSTELSDAFGSSAIHFPKKEHTEAIEVDFENVDSYKSESVVKHSGSGFLNLRDLNTLLLKYIEVAHDLEEIQSGSETCRTIDVKIDEKDITKLDHKYFVEVESWMKIFSDADSKITDLKATVAALEDEKKHLEHSDKGKDGIILERERTCKGLQSKINEIQARLSVFLSQQEIFDAELARLNAKLVYLRGETNCYQALHMNEKMRSFDLTARLNSVEQDTRRKISLKESELSVQKEQASLDTTSLEFRIKGEFAARLKMELTLLRNMFEETMRRNKEKFELEYRSRITGLELDLGLAISQQRSYQDVEIIRGQVGELEERIGHLGGRNLSLAQEWSKLTVLLKNTEAEYSNKMSESDRKIEHLRSENTRITRLYEEMSCSMMMTKVEVGVYDRLLTPEWKRISDRHTTSLGLKFEEAA